MINDIDTRLAAFLVWGTGTLVIYAVVFVRRFHRFVVHRRDRRRRVRRDVRQDVMSGFALLMVSFGSAAATALVLFGETGSSLRGFFVALALGAFTGAGLVMLTEEDANGEVLARGTPDLPRPHDPTEVQ